MTDQPINALIGMTLLLLLDQNTQQIANERLFNSNGTRQYCVCFDFFFGTLAVTFVSVFVMVPIRKISSVPLFVYPGRRGGWKIRVGDGLAGFVLLTIRPKPAHIVISSAPTSAIWSPRDEVICPRQAYTTVTKDRGIK